MLLKQKTKRPRFRSNMLPRAQASAILAHPLGGGLLRREYGGDLPRAGEEVYHAWASGLQRTTYLTAHESIQSFAVDAETGAFLLSIDCMPREKRYLQYVCISYLEQFLS